MLLPTKVIDLVGEERGDIDKAVIIADRIQAKKNLCDLSSIAVLPHLQSFDLLIIPLLVLTKGGRRRYRCGRRSGSYFSIFLFVIHNI